MEAKKNKSTVIFVTIIIILIIALGLMYYFGFVKKDANKENTNKQAKNETEQNVNVPNNTDEKENVFEITYEEETYNSKNENGETSHQNKRNLPIIENEANQDAADKMVESLTEISDKKWDEITEASDEYKDVPEKDGVQYLISTALITDSYIVFKAEESGSFGGVGWTAIELYNFDKKTGKLLTLKDIASDYDGLVETIYETVLNYLENERSIEVTEEIEDTVDELISQDGVWGFTKNGIEINLPKYSVASGAEGIITVEVNKSEINEYLSEDYKF